MEHFRLSSIYGLFCISISTLCKKIYEIISTAILIFSIQTKTGHKKVPILLKELNIPLPNLYEIIAPSNLFASRLGEKRSSK
ncbi:TPA: hypothetical protein ACPJUG_001639 [Haemophilus influenzae]|uniref:Uncharacterized protein n=1 Tax=Haemophilus influenzae TaxID=727 RepID=A0A2S9RP79_HAEIF|nr:hypothetical protein [Haemophilus influenzae]PRI36293.1 hypothetical protein BVZ56_01623 [Haemophilus influenzae]PRI45687.1 hypothetical protein BVZ70_01792 [Haemophilus influenzae]PRI89220.1 hypothetical protein BV020_01377 [Haemophilus influenzae]PRI89631.1 hypothetical protein BV021_01447 [Haemophilus influenzae]PRJ56756.1 hypothetical protein BV094_01707 [Haemophilus influenzae]